MSGRHANPPTVGATVDVVIDVVVLDVLVVVVVDVVDVVDVEVDVVDVLVELGAALVELDAVLVPDADGVCAAHPAAVVAVATASVSAMASGGSTDRRMSDILPRSMRAEMVSG